MSSFFAVYLYAVHNGGIKSSHVIPFESLWYTIAGLECLCVTFITLFFLNINRRYLGTFVSTTTSKQFFCQLFVNAETDEGKIVVFDAHPSLYKPIREDVAIWVADNWAKWNDERPEWFTSKIITNILKDGMAPNEESEDSLSS